MKLKSRILGCLGIAILVISLFLVPVDVKGLTYTPAAISLDKSGYSVGEQPFVTVEDTYSDFDPNAIDTIIVVIGAKVTMSTVGTHIANVKIQETGPDTRIFSGVLPAISAEDMFNDVAQVENKWLEVSYTLGSTKNSDYAALIQPPTQPELPIQPSQPQTSEYTPGSNPSDCPLSFGDYYLNTEYYDFGKITTIDCGYVNDISSVEKSHFAGFRVHYVAKGYDPKPLAGDECMQKDDNWVISSSGQVLVLDLGSDGYGVSEVKTAAKQFFNQLLSANVAALCPSSEPESEQPTQPPTDSDTKDSRCPEGTVYYEKFDSCAVIPPTTEANPTPLADLDNYSEIIEEGERLRYEDKNYNKAILYFKKAIELEPDNVIGYYHLAETLYHHVDKEASVEYYYKMLELIPSHQVAQRALKAMNLPLEPPKELQESEQVPEPQKPMFPQIGVIAAVNELVEVRRGGTDEWIPVKSGMIIYHVDTLRALKNGKAQVLLMDETVFTISGPNAELVLDDFVYDPYPTFKKKWVELTKGIFRWVTGKVAPVHKDFDGGVKIKGICDCGIRATDFIISYDPLTENAQILVNEGVVDVRTDNGNRIESLSAGNGANVDKNGIIEEFAVDDQMWNLQVSKIELLEPTPTQPLAETTPLQTEGNGGCLIATATFGSELAPQVQFLREIRDNAVLSTASGTSFMTAFNAFYYSFSPTISDLERQNPMFKEAVKVAITPLISSLSLLQYVDIDSEAEMLGYGISMILLNIGMYFIVPTVTIVKIGKLFKK